LIPIVAAASAAFCIWITVRIINRRERWAKWTLAGAFGVPLLYAVSFGPACWWLSTPLDLKFDGKTFKEAPILYGPIGWATQLAPEPLASSINWYATLMIGKDEVIFCCVDGIEDSGSVFCNWHAAYTTTNPYLLWPPPEAFCRGQTVAIPVLPSEKSRPAD
jgi:hypothetical protein